MSETLYDSKFQNLFLAFMLRDSAFLDHVVSDVDPEIFVNEVAQRICRLVVDFFNEEKSAPGDVIFHLLDDLYQKGHLPDSLHKTICTYIDDLFAVQLYNRQYLLKEFDRFIRHQLWRKNIIPASELIKSGSFDEAEELLKKTFLHRSSREKNLGRFLTEDPTDRIRRRREEAPQRFWWLVPEIDSKVRGIKRGELGVLQSQRSSGGKSAGLTFLARQFAFQNKRVLIYTLEMSEEDYEDRLDMCISGITKESLDDHALISRKLNKLFRIGGGRIFIKQFPGQLTTLNDLRKHKKMLEQVHGFYADAILVDYADLLAPGKKSRSNDKFDAGKEIYGELRGWATLDNFACWTGMQSNRTAGDQDVADMEHSGESIAKAWTADVIMSINRTAKEQQEGITRLHIAKNRTGEARFTIQITTDFKRMQFAVRNKDF